MTAAILEHPAEPVDVGSTYGGFAAIAQRLNELYPERHKPFSRQLAAKWFRCRGTNGFPDRVHVEINGKKKELFYLPDVERWHRDEHKERPAPRPPIETIPLFQIDFRGMPTY